MSLFARIMVNPASIGDIKTVIGLILEREDESMCVKDFPIQQMFGNVNDPQLQRPNQ